MSIRGRRLGELGLGERLAWGGGGGGGGYSRKRITGLVPGASIAVTIGAGGTAGTTAPLAPTAGGTTSFGAYCSATGGSATNGSDTTSAPPFGNKAGVAREAISTWWAATAGTARRCMAERAALVRVAAEATRRATGPEFGDTPGGGASGAGTGAGWHDRAEWGGRRCRKVAP